MTDAPDSRKHTDSQANTKLPRKLAKEAQPAQESNGEENNGSH